MAFEARSVYECEDPGGWPGPDAPGIRLATLGDVPRLVEMGARFLHTSVYAATLADNPAEMAHAAAFLITDPRGLVLVSVDASTAAAAAADRLTGMLGVMIVPHLLSGELVAGELFWWVEPEARGDGLALLRQAEAWARARGVPWLQMIVPASTPKLARVFARLGYTAIETTYARRLSPLDAGPVPRAAAPSTLDAVAAACRVRVATAAPPLTSIAAAAPDVGIAAIRVHEDVLPADYRAFARDRGFGPVTIGAATFHGIAECTDRSLTRWISARYPRARPTLTFFRQSPAGQIEPNYVHTDRDMGDWTAILYLTDDPAPGDGTTFWRHRPTGATASTATTEAAFRAEWQAWRDLAQWAPWHTVPAAPSRLLLFPAPCFHSRAIRENYGTAGVDARLIQLVFGTGSLEPAEGASCV